MRRFHQGLGVTSFLSVVLFTIISYPSLGQERGTAGIYGKITDSQGAAVPQALITLTQVATGDVRTTTSNVSGDYQFPLIPLGEYRLDVERQGFKKYEMGSIRLEASDNLKVDAELKVGQVSTTVTVTAEAAAVDTNSSTLKETVDSTRVMEIPLNGRNVADLAFLVAGAEPASGVTGDVGAGARSSDGSVEISVNGNRYNNVKYTLDGGDNNDSLVNLNLTFPFPDAVQEFSFETSNAGSDIGRSDGGAVHVITKSGTNAYHGDLFSFVRNTDLNARSFFSQTPDYLKRNQDGGTFGGPIRKNKLFVFGGFQRTWARSLSGSTRSLTMPAIYRTGNFSALLAQSKPVQLTDPQNGGVPFTGDIIPSTRISSVTQAILKIYPVPGPDGFAYYTTANKTDAYQTVVRSDYHPSARHNILVRYLQDDYDSPYVTDPNNLNSAGNGNLVHDKNGTIGETFIVNPHLVADTHITLAREVGSRPLDFPGTMADYGINFSPLSNQRNMSINGTSGLSIGGGNAPGVWFRTNIEFTNAWHWIKGRHDILWGGELMTTRYNEYNMFDGSGVFGFDGRASGFDQADFLLGYVSTFTQENGEIEFRRYHYQAFYGSDSFRVSRRLTLNFGLRWEPYTPITDVDNRSVQFRQDQYLKGVTSPHFVNAPPGLFYPGDSVSGFTVPKAGAAGDMKNFGPRVGFAWDVFGKSNTSLRGGFGIFYDTPETFSLNNMNDQSPFSYAANFQGGNTVASLIPFANPYLGRQNLNLFPMAGDFSSTSPFQIPFEAIALPLQWQLAYNQQWNLTLERTLASGWLFRVSYVGMEATHLLGNYDMNAPIYNSSQTLAQNISTVNARRPRLQYQQIYMMCFCLPSSYNALQVTAKKRLSHGFSLLSAYTWSKNIDYLSGNHEASTSAAPDPFNLYFNRGVSDFDHPHRLVNSFVWNLPDAGKPLRSRVMSAIVGSWQMAGIYTIQSGRPFSVTSSNNAVAGAGTAYGSQLGSLSMPSGRTRGQTISEFFNIANITQATAGSYGNMGRNQLRGPRYSDLDASMSKTVPLKFREAAKLQFRAEFFNVPNLPQLSVPNSKLGQSIFGSITGTDNSPRILQFGLKLDF